VDSEQVALWRALVLDVRVALLGASAALREADVALARVETVLEQQEAAARADALLAKGER
jgi:hypothetical protein